MIDQEPNPITNNEEWLKNDNKARATILLNINDLVLHVSATMTAQKAWDALNKLFPSKNVANKLLLHHQLYSL